MVKEQKIKFYGIYKNRHRFNKHIRDNKTGKMQIIKQPGR